MQAGDTVQVRQFDAVDHWIYAKVLDPATRLVEINHPGNVDHGKQKIFPAGDIRTKADLLALVTTAQGLSTARLTDAQINTLSATDGFFKQFTQSKDASIAKLRDSLHTRIVDHFQKQADALS